jgi:hypothetical protein
MAHCPACVHSAHSIFAGSRTSGSTAITFAYSTHGHRPWFTLAPIVGVAFTQIEQQAAIESVAMVACCFMPDHLHLLIQGDTEAADCLRFITRMKQASAFAVSRRFGIGSGDATPLIRWVSRLILS